MPNKYSYIYFLSKNVYTDVHCINGSKACIMLWDIDVNYSYMLRALEAIQDTKK